VIEIQKTGAIAITVAILATGIECVKGTSFCLLNGLALRGEIDDEATAKLRRLLEELDRKSPPNVDRGNIQIKLDSPGGSVAAAMEIGRLMRKYRMAAAVMPNSICVSACVLIYAGAVARLFLSTWTTKCCR
jgi:ATP-dependent protease ClpP protease subunit